MIVTYGLTAWLAGAGGPDRPENRPFLPLLLAARVASDVVVDVKLAGEEWSENKALCAWCQAATVVSGVSLALSPPGAHRAWRRLRGR